MKKVRQILRPEIMESTEPARQLGAWLGYHGKNLRWLSEVCGVKTGTLSSVVNGSRKSQPVLEQIQKLAGIRADSWKGKT